MAEVQRTENTGEFAEKFLGLVMMLAQQAALFLGKIPHPETGATEVNVEAARMFIDHLEMLRVKTRGNLSKQEEDLLTMVLSDLQMAFVQAGSTAGAPAADSPAPEATPETNAPDDDEENKKKFSKTY